MPEPIYPIAAICAGACVAFATVAVADRAQSIDAIAWLERARHPQAQQRDHDRYSDGGGAVTPAIA